jgi:hypothetical protein
MFYQNETFLKRKAKQKSGRVPRFRKPRPAFNAKRTIQTKIIHLAKNALQRYNNCMLGAGFPLYAVGGHSPSVWGDLL